MITPPDINVVNTNITIHGPVESVDAGDDRLLDRADASDRVRLLALKHRIEKIVKKNARHEVRTDVSVSDVTRGNYLIAHNENDPHFAASVNKLPVALLLLEELRAGNVSLDTQMTWTAADVRGGFGLYDQPGAPLTASLEDVLYDMLNRSGNTVVRVIVNSVLGGPHAVNDRLAAKPELVHTRLIPLDATRFFLGNTTSKESLWVMTELMEQQDGYATFMKNAMQTNIFTDFGVRSQLLGNDYIMLVNKIGLLDDVDGNNRHDVGLIYNTKTHKTYGFSLLTTAPFNETDDSATVQANSSIMQMGRSLLRFAGDKQGKPGASAMDEFGTFAAPAAPNLTPEKKVLY